MDRIIRVQWIQRRTNIGLWPKTLTSSLNKQDVQINKTPKHNNVLLHSIGEGYCIIPEKKINPGK